jgi:hypothetical protein
MADKEKWCEKEAPKENVRETRQKRRRREKNLIREKTFFA